MAPFFKMKFETVTYMGSCQFFLNGSLYPGYCFMLFSRSWKEHTSCSSSHDFVSVEHIQLMQTPCRRFAKYVWWYRALCLAWFVCVIIHCYLIVMDDL